MSPQMASLQETFRRRIETDREYCQWALVELFGYQTDDEQAEGRTKYSNGVGFNSIDDQILTRLAERCLNGRILTADDRAELCERLPKYWQQFVVVTLAEPPRQNAMKKGASAAVIPSEVAA